ncbi:MAG: DUF5658 family protein [Nitrososphaerales archaeon]
MQESNGRAKQGVSIDIVELLLVWYIIFGIMDVITTYWLIQNYSAGISGEANPLGRALWDQFGLAGLILGKVLVFIPMSAAVVYIHSAMKEKKWFREALETILLGMIGYSLIVILNNVVGAILVSAYYDPRVLTTIGFLYFKLGILALCVGVVVAGLHFTKQANDSLRVVEASVGVLVVITPTLFAQGVFHYLIVEQPLLFIAYLFGVLSILGIAFYMAESILRMNPRPSN